MPSRGNFGFRPYELDVRGHRLLRDGKPVPLPPRQFHLLHVLIERAGEVVTTRELLDIVWPGVFVEPSSVTRGISRLRIVLDRKHPDRYIETVPRVGYRFVKAMVTQSGSEKSPAKSESYENTPNAPRVALRATDAEIDAAMVPHRVAIAARAALESLQLHRTVKTVEDYEALLTERSDDPRVHIGLANAYLARYEATRADIAPDMDALRRAEAHAREAIRLNLLYATAWTTLGQILARLGDYREAIAAHRCAMDLEPKEWVHALRFTMTAWGGDRLEGVRILLKVMPGLPAAFWFDATVHVGRNALAEARQALAPGLAAIARGTLEAAIFPPIALNWLSGMVAHAMGDDNEMRIAFARERAVCAGGTHIYARETDANVCYAIGGIELTRGNITAAKAALAEAITLVPGHVMAMAALARIERMSRRAKGRKDTKAAPVAAHLSPLDAALSEAVMLVGDDHHREAARLVAAALRITPHGNHGWTIPIDPLLDVQNHLDAWAEVLEILRVRAS